MLKEHFTYDEKEEAYRSNKKWLGLGTGDDSTLFIFLGEQSTVIYWRQNRGYESTIFDGKHLSEDELETVLNLLEIPALLKWK